MAIKIISTEDGSHSLFDEELNETYHSTRGALGESMHVFIKEGLEHLLDKSKLEEVKVLEVGLGTGLNVFLTAQFAEQRKLKIHTTSLEPFPISYEIYSQLSYGTSTEERELLFSIHDKEWEKEVKISSHLVLEKTTAKLETFQSLKSYNLIYFDAFAPSKQAEVWALENLKKCFKLLSPGGMLTTYCAQGQFKRNLVEVGFEVETLQGAMGKKEMVRAVKAT